MDLGMATMNLRVVCKKHHVSLGFHRNYHTIIEFLEIVKAVSHRVTQHCRLRQGKALWALAKSMNLKHTLMIFMTDSGFHWDKRSSQRLTLTCSADSAASLTLCVVVCEII